MSVLWLKSGYTVKYSLSPQEIPWATPSGFPSCSGYISPYIPPLIIIQIQWNTHANKQTYQVFKTISGYYCLSDAGNVWWKDWGRGDVSARPLNIQSFMLEMRLPWWRHLLFEIVWIVAKKLKIQEFRSLRKIWQGGLSKKVFYTRRGGQRMSDLAWQMG